MPVRRRRRATSVGSGLAGEQRERFGLQTVAGQNGDAVAVHDVQRRPAAPQRVVVHGRQVVVDERVGVNQLDRAGGRQREVARGRVDGLRGRERQHGPQALAAGEHAVAHRLADERRAPGGLGR